MTLTTAPLMPETWPAFSALVEAHNGVWGGCWCLGFHAGNKEHGDIENRRATKEAWVRERRTHAALVLEDGACLGWAQYGSPAELPAIKNRKRYEAGATALPDWRITCLFVAQAHRGRGVAVMAIKGALVQIAAAGGGRVEAYPEAVEGRKAASTFLWSGTMSMFEGLGFVRERQIGKHQWVVAQNVPSALGPKKSSPQPQHV